MEQKVMEFPRLVIQRQIEKAKEKEKAAKDYDIK